MPQISVIVPIYNAEKYLCRCLDSVLQQTMTDFELLCIDDGTSGACSAVLRQYAEADKRIKVIRQKHLGVSVARNKGMELARGNYLFFLDADDYIHPQALSLLYGVAIKYQADVVVAMMEKVYPEMKVVCATIDENQVGATVFANPFVTFLKDRRLRSSSNARLYAKPIVEEVRFVEGIRYEDVPFNVEVMYNARKAAFVNENIYYYFQHAESFMHQPFVDKNVDDYVTAINKVYEFCKTHCPERISEIRRYVLNLRVKMMLNQAVRKQKDYRVQKELFVKIQSEVMKLYNEGIISYDGLGIKHKIRLWLLLNCKSAEPCRYWANLI